MEVFKVFATLSLVDMLSGPLDKIRHAMGSVDTATKSLNARMGRLALAMGPLAMGAGVLLGSFGACVSTAAGFEDQLAKVAAVSRASGADLKALEDKARELGATTQFTAVQVGQAEQFLAMAGFSVQENIAALPGVLNLAAATATDLGRAADISSDIMSAFGIQAAEMGHVADVLTATCNSANTNMEMLGDTMKYVGPVARTAGLSLEEAATMAGILANSGIKASQGGTVLRSMLNRLAAPTGEAAKTLQKLGVTTQDAAGNLKKPITIMKEMAASMQGMGNAAQMAALKTIFGDEAMAGVSVLLKNADGDWNKLFDTLSKVDGVAQNTADAMNDTLAGSVRSMGSAWESLQITIGKIFIPIVRKGVDALTWLLRMLDAFANSPIGNFLIKTVAALASFIVTLASVAAGIWAVGKAASAIGPMFTALKVAILGVGAPFWIIIGIGSALYAAWKTNFGGIADMTKNFAKKVRLVIDGVKAVFASLSGTTGTIRGELAKEIKAEGLVSLVTNVGKLVYRIKEFFAGMFDGFSLAPALKMLEPAMQRIRTLFQTVGEAIGRLFGFEIISAASEARSFGELLGGIVSWGVEGLALVVTTLVRGIENVIAIIRIVCSIFTGDWAGAIEQAKVIWNNLVETFLSFADLFRIGDWIREAWAEATEWLSSINLFESGAKLIETLKEGILSAASGLVDSVKGVFQKVRNLLPFSDAKEGPLSTLTLSGSRLMTTLGEGVSAGFPNLMQTISGKFQTLKDGLGSVWQGLFGADDAPELVAPRIPDAPGMQPDVAEARQHDAASRTLGREQPSFTLHIANITLPNVKDANDFYDQLKSAAMEYGESMA